jgi:chromosome partitioning protein
VRQVVKTVKNVNALLHHPVQIHGVLPTFYDARARICRDAVEALREHFGDRVLPPIRQATRLKEAPAQGKTIFEFAPESNASQDYEQVVNLLVAGAESSAQQAAAV